jgi:single-strand DNA-binding protein
MLNRFSFIGNLGQDAQVRTLDSGTSAISFSVAVTEKYKDKQGNTQEITTWVSCTRWVPQGGSTALANYLLKGQKVYVEGKPSARAYLTQANEPAAVLDVRVEKIELLGGAQAQAAPQAQAAAPQPQAPRPSAPQRYNHNDLDPEAHDDLPF